ncbi:AAA family ATPase [Cupriavidus basilensis]|uniref:AAA family ATPase n=1 Tax=Cupriavidus basilensis TaxID=68895 RepID=UPI0023E82982|nr:AAA family ATPase [Cupriavidus basilensis]MDF3883905.1 AAA family ATPase [Cupriavidus basilensis]
MAKIAVVSADETRRQQIAGLIAQAANHVVQQVRTTPAQALSQPGLTQGADLLILEARSFSVDDLNQLRLRLADRHDTLCMLVTESPSADLLMRAMRAGVQCVLPWPPDAQEFRDELQRCTSHAISSSRGEAQVLSFLSCKGGSGTTFAATNLGHVLAAKHNKRVLLIDLNQQYGDAAFLLTDQVPPATLVDVCRQIDRLDASLLDACVTHIGKDFDVLPGAGDPVKAGEIKAAHLERILALVVLQYDVVIFDVGQDINPASIQVLDHSHLIYPVLQLNLTYLRAGRRLLEICQSLGYHAEQLRLVVNQYDKHAPISLRLLEETFGMPASHVLPNDPVPVRDAIGQGMPVLQLAESSQIARALVKMANQLYPETAPRSAGLLSKLLGQGNRVAPAIRLERQA